LRAVRLGSRRVRVKRADLDSVLAAGSTGEGDGAQGTEHELRADLAASLDRVQVQGADDAELAGALRSSAQAANRPARAIERKGILPTPLTSDVPAKSLLIPPFSEEPSVGLEPTTPSLPWNGDSASKSLHISTFWIRR